MSLLNDDLAVARVTKRGVAVLLALVGVALLMASDLGDHARYLTGIGLIAVAAGIWRQQRWARWLGLGACFLMIVVACVIPVLMFLVLPLRGFDGGMRMTLLWMLVCLAFGTAGYKGLGYFRSEKGRLDFAGGDSVEQHALMGETSAAVVWSAGVWVLLLGSAWFMGLGTPSWLFWHIQPAEPRAVPRSAPLEYTYFEVQREQRKFEGNDPASARFRVVPDLIPVGLCTRGGGAARTIDVVYANVGGGRGYRSFRMASSSVMGDGPENRSTELPVPDPDTLAVADLALASSGRDGYVYVDADPFKDIVESDETNNSARFEVTHNRQGGVALPACDAVRLRFRPHDGPTQTAATVAPMPMLPDLVPLGLCARDDFLIGVRFTNQGAPGSGSYQIAQGRGAAGLKLEDKAYLSVPVPQSVMGFNLGTVAELVGKRGQSATIAVELDITGAIHEENETNNFISARVTRRSDGSVDLPQCEQFETVAGKTIVAHESVAPGALDIPLPDLVALGGCIASGNLPGFMVVFGNAGPVANPQAFTLDARMAGGSLQANIKPDHFGPGLLWKQYFSMTPKAGDTLLLEIDTYNQIAESDESNNKLTLEFPRLPDGRVDVPACPSVTARVSDWMAMIRRQR